MQWLQNTYTRRFNSRHRTWGRLFGDRYKAIPVDGQAGDFYGTLINYIHLNPVRAGLIDIEQGESVMTYPWSSLARGFAVLPSRRVPWLEVTRALAAFVFADTTAGRRRYVERLDAIARHEQRRDCGVPPAIGDARSSHLRQGWYWGGQAFAEKLLGLVGARSRAAPNRTYRSSPVQQAHGAPQAEELLQAGLRVHDLPADRLAHLPGLDPRKIALAQHLWEETTVSQSWIAERLRMKSAANVSQILRRAAKQLASP